MLMSSSRSGQWTCRPSPNSSQLSRSCKVAWTSLGYQGSCGGESDRHPTLAGGLAQPQGHMSLAGAAVTDGDDVLTALYVFATGQLNHHSLIHRWDGREVEGVQAFHRGEAGGPDPTLHHWLVPVDELKRSQPEQVLGMIHTLGGAPRGHLPYSRRKQGSSSSFR